jgi:precorrin-6B methylase 2
MFLTKEAAANDGAHVVMNVIETENVNKLVASFY